MRETNGAAIVGDDVRDRVGSGGVAEDLAELVLGLSSLDLVHDKTSLHVVEKSEELAGLLDGHNIVEAHRVVGVAANLVVDLDVPSLVSDNHEDLTIIQGVFQTIADEHHQGDTLAELVGAWGGSWSPHAGEFVQHPVLRREDSLEMFLGSSGLKRVKEGRLPFYGYTLASKLNNT